MKQEQNTLILFTLIGLMLLFGTFLDPGTVSGLDNQNITTQVNVTNTNPTIFDVVVDDSTQSPADQIDLVADSVREVICNASVSDPDGFADIVNATARLYSIANAGFDGAADNNNHYRNNSCLECYAITGAPNNASCICRFNIEYYANNENWECNINVSDNGGIGPLSQKVYITANNSDTTTVNGLLAVGAAPAIVDYGNLSVTETSGITIINVTNAGNIQTNFTVYGYGGPNEAEGINTSMLCEQGNITIGNERYSNSSTAAFEDMINLTSDNRTYVNNVTLLQRTNDVEKEPGKDINTTYWRIRVPLGVGGLCNGTIVFTATNDAT